MYPTTDDDVIYLFLQKQKIGAELHIYLEEGAYHYKGRGREQGTEVREGGIGIEHAMCGSVRISRRDRRGTLCKGDTRTR
jgi:hypothetical protein